MCRSTTTTNMHADAFVTFVTTAVFFLPLQFTDLIHFVCRNLTLPPHHSPPPPPPSTHVSFLFLTAANKDQLESAGSPLKRALAKHISCRRPRHTYAEVSPFSLSLLEMREATLGSAGAASSSRVTSMKCTTVKPSNLRPKAPSLHSTNQQPWWPLKDSSHRWGNISGSFMKKKHKLINLARIGRWGGGGVD